MATKLLVRQLGQLAKEDIPNIKVHFGDDVTKIGVVFHYQRMTPEAEEPLFMPKECGEPVLIHGEVELKDFPNRPPKLRLFGDLTHCHVYNWGDHSIICFSLDETYQGYFSGKHMRSSRFNPSVSLAYYLKSVYKFLAEDDMEHPISDEAKKSCFEYWRSYKTSEKDHPNTKLTYQEWHTMAMEDTVKIDKGGLCKQVVDRYGISDIPQGVALMRDFVDKTFMLPEGEPVVIGIKHQKTSRHIYSIAGLDKMRISTFDTGVRKTSIGVDFNQCLPLVIHSRIWDSTKSMAILHKMVTSTLGKLQAQPIVRIKDKVQIYDSYLFVIAELFNEMAIEVFKGDVFPCEEVMRGFVYLHHLLLVIKRDHPQIIARADEILDSFEGGQTNKKECPNLGILMTLYLLSTKERGYETLIHEMFARNCSWALGDPRGLAEVVKYSPHNVMLPKKKTEPEEKEEDDGWMSGRKKKQTKKQSGQANFRIEDMDRWIDKSWVQSHAGMQRFAFQQLYNVRFKNETLESMDSKFGQVSQEEIELFQKRVKELNAWAQLPGRQGYKAFLDYFGTPDTTLEADLKVALDRSSVEGYDGYTVKRFWSNKSSGQSYKKY